MSMKHSPSSTSSASSSSVGPIRRTRGVKEKVRNEEINAAFDMLQSHVPCIPSNQKLPKIKTLRLAYKYIEHLRAVLEGSQMESAPHHHQPRALSVEDFAQVALQEVQQRNTYSERVRCGEARLVRKTSRSPPQKDEVPAQSVAPTTYMLPLMQAAPLAFPTLVPSPEHNAYSYPFWPQQ